MTTKRSPGRPRKEPVKEEVKEPEVTEAIKEPETTKEPEKELASKEYKKGDVSKNGLWEIHAVLSTHVVLKGTKANDFSYGYPAIPIEELKDFMENN